VTDNYLANNTYFPHCTPTAMTGNSFYGTTVGFTANQYPNNTYYSSRPTGTKIFIRPNAYEFGRANITVFNWANAATVSVDLTGVAYAGGSFQIRNAQNFFGEPVVSGVFDGSPVTLPMTGLTTAAPVGLSAPPATGPEFNAFILLSLPGPNEFFDVAPANLFHDAISVAAANGITVGCGDGDFCPSLPVRRDQMAVFLMKGQHGGSYQPPAASGTVFSDVPASAFAAAWIERAKAEGVATGCGNGRYCPGSPVSRAQMAVLLLKARLGSSYVPPAATGTVFSDVHRTDFAAAWIEDLSRRGITSGCGGGKYCPGHTVTRAQTAALLVRTFSLQ
jgi:hypothetical protein